jgi:hypothetical protein
VKAARLTAQRCLDDWYGLGGLRAPVAAESLAMEAVLALSFQAAEGAKIPELLVEWRAGLCT